MLYQPLVFLRRRFGWFFLLTVITVILIGQKIFIAVPSGAQDVQTKTFESPSIGGQRLDWCHTWRTDCGVLAAKAFCQLNGYTEVVNFLQDTSPTITQVIGDGRTCQEPQNNPRCDSFKFITCANSYNDNPLMGTIRTNIPKPQQKPPVVSPTNLSTPKLPTNYLGNNVRNSTSNRVNSDLPGGESAARNLFEKLTAGKYKITNKNTLVGDNGVRLRVGNDGRYRIDIPSEGSRLHETIHFNN